MESNINWLDLPDNIWESILNNLEDKDLLKASETCKKFNNLLSISSSLTKKLRLEIGNKLMEIAVRMFKNGNAMCIFHLVLMKQCLQKSERKYDKIRIYAILDFEQDDMMYAIYDILKLLAGSVKEITFYNAKLNDDEFFKIMQIMKNLKVLKFCGGSFCNEDVTEIVRPDIVPSIQEIYIETVEEFSFEKLYLFDAITTLDLSFCTTVDETFENFLLMQKNLKVLRLWYSKFVSSLFNTDKLASTITFSLEKLTLAGVEWTNNESAMKFFKTQTKLKHLQLDLQHLYKFKVHDQIVWFNKFLVQFFVNNLQLKTVALSTSECNIKDYRFLEGIVNPSVDHLDLRLDSSQNGTEHVAALTKLFPNVKNLVFTAVNQINHGMDQICNWKLLETISCIPSDINQFSKIVSLGEKLTTCTIIYSSEEYLNKPQMINFLNRHQNIKHMILKSYIYNNTLVTDEMLSLIVNNSKSLETLISDGKICSFSDYHQHTWSQIVRGIQDN